MTKLTAFSYAFASILLSTSACTVTETSHWSGNGSGGVCIVDFRPGPCSEASEGPWQRSCLGQPCANMSAVEEELGICTRNQEEWRGTCDNYAEADGGLSDATPQVDAAVVDGNTAPSADGDGVVDSAPSPDDGGIVDSAPSADGGGIVDSAPSADDGGIVDSAPSADGGGVVDSAPSADDGPAGDSVHGACDGGKGFSDGG